MPTLLAFLSTTAGLLVAIGTVLAALGGIVTAIVKVVGTRARVAKLEAALGEIQTRLTRIKSRLDRRDAQAKVTAGVESVRASLLPEHAEADDLEEVRAEVDALKAMYLAEMRTLGLGFAQIETTMRLILEGKVKLQ